MRGGWKGRGYCHVFGDNLPHDNGMIALSYVIERQTDPAMLIPHLFEQINPTFATRVKPGDYVVAGRGFGAGKAHTNAYIAMEALDLRVLCETTFRRVVRATANLALPIMAGCAGVTSALQTGDEIEADMAAGEIMIVATGQRMSFPPVPPDMRQVIEMGGREGTLRKWLSDHPHLAEPYASDRPAVEFA